MTIPNAARDSNLLSIRMEAREICEASGRTAQEEVQAVEYSLRYREFMRSIETFMETKCALTNLNPLPHMIMENGRLSAIYPSPSEDIKRILDLCDEQIKYWRDYYFGELKDEQLSPL